MATRKPTTHIYKDVSVSTPIIPQPTRLKPQQFEEKEKKGFSTVVIENTLKVISVLRRSYFTIKFKRREYTPRTNPRRGRNESDHIV